mmetsp:Transcript_6817/g.26345  ORF Transcript_6817/g.26345 Transcript_6817/m.26345 type:complete len:275 (-) Transcript_6817:123-947(-)
MVEQKDHGVLVASVALGAGDPRDLPERPCRHLHLPLVQGTVEGGAPGILEVAGFAFAAAAEHRVRNVPKRQLLVHGGKRQGILVRPQPDVVVDLVPAQGACSRDPRAQEGVLGDAHGQRVEHLIPLQELSIEHGDRHMRKIELVPLALPRQHALKGAQLPPGHGCPQRLRQGHLPAADGQLHLRRRGREKRLRTDTISSQARQTPLCRSFRCHSTTQLQRSFLRGIHDASAPAAKRRGGACPGIRTEAKKATYLRSGGGEARRNERMALRCPGH